MIRSILIVDPDPDLREMLGAILSLEGHTPCFARDVLEAEDVMRCHGAFDLIVVDAALEGALGFIKENRIHPIIVISSAAQKVLDRAKTAGAVATFTKPFGLDILLESVAIALGTSPESLLAPLGLSRGAVAHS